MSGRADTIDEDEGANEAPSDYTWGGTPCIIHRCAFLALAALALPKQIALRCQTVEAASAALSILGSSSTPCARPRRVRGSS